MTNRCDRLAGIAEVTHQLQHVLVQPQVLGRPTAWNNERMVTRCVARREIGGDGKTVPRLFAVGLVPFEIVNGCHDVITRGLVRTNRIDVMADRLKDLERNHRFVIFNEVTDEHQNSFGGHERNLE